VTVRTGRDKDGAIGVEDDTESFIDPWISFLKPTHRLLLPRTIHGLKKMH
jgi:hypothetical protein